MMNSSHKWARLFSQIGLNRTFLKQSSILWGVRQKLGTDRLFNGGSWCGVLPLKMFEILHARRCTLERVCTQYLHLCDRLCAPVTE